MDICKSLSFPDSKLLQKFEKDLPLCHPDAQALGADLSRESLQRFAKEAHKTQNKNG